MGCVPVFCDVAPNAFSPDLAHFATLVAAQEIKALIVVPMWGYPLDMTTVAQFCKARGVALIEDCAHAFGVKVDGKYLGTFGDVSTFSTHERKLVSTGEGGFCLTADRAAYEGMLSWQHHGLAVSKRSREYKLGEGIGTNFKLSPMCAALGINQFKKLDAKIAARRDRVERIRRTLADIPNIVEFARYRGEEINGYAMVYRCLDGSSRECAQELSARGIVSDTVRYEYKPLYQEPAFVDYAVACPNAERIIETIFTVPCHEGLAAEDLAYIESVIHRLFADRGAVR
jgi:dTDP-4-amino-4,6-dideoxygalactose transaminase